LNGLIVWVCGAFPPTVPWSPSFASTACALISWWTSALVTGGEREISKELRVEAQQNFVKLFGFCVHAVQNYRDKGVLGGVQKAMERWCRDDLVRPVLLKTDARTIAAMLVAVASAAESSPSEFMDREFPHTQTLFDDLFKKPKQRAVMETFKFTFTSSNTAARIEFLRWIRRRATSAPILSWREKHLKKWCGAAPVDAERSADGGPSSGSAAVGGGGAAGDSGGSAASDAAGGALEVVPQPVLQPVPQPVPQGASAGGEASADASIDTQGALARSTPQGGANGGSGPDRGESESSDGDESDDGESSEDGSSDDDSSERSDGEDEDSREGAASKRRKVSP